MTTSNLPFRFGLSVLITVIVLAFAIHTEVFLLMPMWLEVIALTILACFQLIVSHLLDFKKMRDSIFELTEKGMRLLSEKKVTEKELSELREVIASFLEHSEIYRERVRDFLKLYEDYVCIVKSAEGFGDVWTELSNEQKRPLPFTTVLMNLPGSIRPIENMGFFLIPTATLKGVNKMPLRSYINKYIVPKVHKERQAFLKNLPKSLAVKADDFSYKYIAFFLRKDAIAHETKNRKFNRDFNNFIVNEQTGDSFYKMKSELIEVIKGKDVLKLVNWSSFAKLNDERQEFIEKNKSAINAGLLKNGIVDINDLAKTDPEKLFEIIWISLKVSQRQETTEKKVKNLSVSVVEGAQKTIEALKKSGVNI